MITTSKLPTSDRPLIQDVDLANAVERELKNLKGKDLERAQEAIRRVRASAVEGSFDTILTAYRSAIKDAVRDGQ